MSETDPVIWPEKRAADKLDYSLDWSDLGTDPITASVWTVPADLTQSALSFQGYDGTATPIVQNSTLIWLAGGTSGSTYECLNRVTTASGRIVERAARIAVA